jgi:hypothetical protein
MAGGNVPVVGCSDGQQMYVRATEVESPVAVMAVGALEVRVRCGVRLHMGASSSLTLEAHSKEGRFMYDGRICVPGSAAEVCCLWNLLDGTNG